MIFHDFSHEKSPPPVEKLHQKSRGTEPSQASGGAPQHCGGPVGRQRTERSGEERRGVALGEVLESFHHGKGRKVEMSSGNPVEMGGLQSLQQMEDENWRCPLEIGGNGGLHYIE